MASNLMGSIVILLFWFGKLNYYLPHLIIEFFYPNFNPREGEGVFILLHDLFDFIISTMIYMLPFVIIAAVFDELSYRYKFNSWGDMRKARENDYKDSFKDCGKVVNIDLDEGGFLSNRHVTIKTDKAIYRCIGTITKVKIGSKVRSQNGDLLVIDNGCEKRLSLA